MMLTLLFDHRFYRDSQGTIFSPKCYNYQQMSQRCHEVFPSLRVIARVSENNDVEANGRCAEGENVEVISVGDWNDMIGFIKKRRSIAQNLETYMNDATAVILIALGMIGTVGYKMLLRKNQPYGVEVVGDPYDALAPGCVKHPLRPFFRLWFSHQLRVQCRHAAGVLYVTENALQKRYPAAPGVFTTYCSNVELTDAAYSHSRSYRSLPPSFTLVNVGLMSQPYKAHDVMIDAVAQCVKKGLDVQLVLIGDGAYRSDFRQRAQSLGVENRVIFRGLLPGGDAVREELDRADLFLLPSRTEGLPRALVEAMARGLPCIGTSVGGIPELLHPDDLVPPGDAAALSQKILEVLASPSRLEQMSARNFAKSFNYEYSVLHNRRNEFYRYIREKTLEWRNR